MPFRTLDLGKTPSALGSKGNWIGHAEDLIQMLQWAFTEERRWFRSCSETLSETILRMHTKIFHDVISHHVGSWDGASCWLQEKESKGSVNQKRAPCPGALSIPTCPRCLLMS